MDISYNLTYQSDGKNLSFIQFGAILQQNKAGTVERMVEGLEQDTTYTITVSAVNDWGTSPSAGPLEVTTIAFTSELSHPLLRCSGERLIFCFAADDPGALLVANAMEVFYYQVNDATISESIPVVNTRALLYTFNSTVRGVHVYVSTCVRVCVHVEFEFVCVCVCSVLFQVSPITLTGQIWSMRVKFTSLWTLGKFES